MQNGTTESKIKEECDRHAHGNDHGSKKQIMVQQQKQPGEGNSHPEGTY
jgi:hypothetical protein